MEEKEQRFLITFDPKTLVGIPTKLLSAMSTLEVKTCKMEIFLLNNAAET
jgi:hypothetical protein